jgi:hypothetical protein
MADKDKPGGMLEIPASLGRDLDKAAQGKIPPPPLEAFLSDSALEAAERATAAASEPVHAEDLKPLSKAEAARRTTFSGHSLPPVPSTRKVIPAPFRRPAVTGGRHGKAWQPVRAGQVVPGDIVPDLGRVVRAEERVVREVVAGTEAATAVEVVLTGAGGVTRAFRPDEPVRVFRAAAR